MANGLQRDDNKKYSTPNHKLYLNNQPQVKKDLELIIINFKGIADNSDHKFLAESEHQNTPLCSPPSCQMMTILQLCLSEHPGTTTIKVTDYVLVVIIFMEKSANFILILCLCSQLFTQSSNHLQIHCEIPMKFGPCD